jgi:putative peptidoglycan lipid II flippase
MSLLLTLPFVFTFLLIPGTIMRAVFAHGHFDRNAATLAGQVLAAYGVGLPAMALVRIVASTFYARHDTLTPVRATVTAMICNISLKVLFVWGFQWGIAGVALSTSLGAWINVAVLTWYGHSRTLLAIEKNFLRSLGPALLAALVCGACAWAGARLGNLLVRGHYTDVAGLAFAMICAATGYSAVVLLFRKSLPLGKIAR